MTHGNLTTFAPRAHTRLSKPYLPLSKRILPARCLTAVRLIADTPPRGDMDFVKEATGARDQRAVYDALGVLVMMFVVLLVVGALGLHVMG